MLSLAPSTLEAASFDAQNGKLVLDPQAVSFSFDSTQALPSTLRWRVHDNQFQDQNSRRIQNRIVGEQEALEGQGALALGGDLPHAVFFMDALTDSLKDKSVEITIWMKAQGTMVRPLLAWNAGDSEQAYENLDFGPTQRMGTSRLIATGQATDDGWLEYSSGPMDFALGGTIAPILVLDDAQRQSNAGFWHRDMEARALIDALEIKVLGPAKVGPKQCLWHSQTTDCGAEGTCHMGRCVDRVAVYGPIPKEAADRAGYLSRMKFSLEKFAGNRHMRKNWQRLMQTLDQQIASTTLDLWSQLSEVYYAAGDGHGQPPLMGLANVPSAGVCLGIGESDLLPNVQPMPMVFSVHDQHPIAPQLQVGDVLTHVDGMDVHQWRLAHRELFLGKGIPETHIYDDILAMPGIAMRTGSELTFARCTKAEGCSEAEVASITIDLSSFNSELWQNQSPGWQRAVPLCDGRFTRLSSLGGNPLADTFAAMRTVRGHGILAINAVPHPAQQGGAAWVQTVDGFFANPPSKMILDQRRGHGGTFYSVFRIQDYLMNPDEFVADLLYPWLGEKDEDPVVRQSLKACAEMRSGLEVHPCEGTFWVTTEAAHPGKGRAASTKLAIVNGRDVSGNDYLTYHLKRRRAETRVFGPVPTWGAFGIVYELPHYDMGFIGGSFQIDDSIIVMQPGDALDTTQSGRGVPMDQVVMQRQSDALNGIDTIMEAAHVWLDQE